MNSESQNNKIPINRLHLTQSSGDLRKAYRVILSPLISAIDHKYLKCLPGIYVDPIHEEKTWENFRNSFHRYHKTITNDEINLYPPFNQFKFFRYFSNIRIIQVVSFHKKIGRASCRERV